MDPISYLQNLTHAGLVSERAADVATLMGRLHRAPHSVIELTIPLAAVSFALGLALAVVLALVRIKEVPSRPPWPGSSSGSCAGRPCSMQLFIVFFGLPGLGAHGGSDSFGDPSSSRRTSAPTRRKSSAAPSARPEGAVGRGAFARVDGSGRHALDRPSAGDAHRLPALVNTLLGLIKDTSLASAVTVVEMFMAAQLAAAAQRSSPSGLYMEAAFIYLMISTVVAAAGAALEKRLASRALTGAPGRDTGETRETRKGSGRAFRRNTAKPLPAKTNGRSVNVSSVQIFRRIHAFAVGEEHPRGSSPSRKENLRLRKAASGSSDSNREASFLTQHYGGPHG